MDGGLDGPCIGVGSRAYVPCSWFWLFVFSSYQRTKHLLRLLNWVETLYFSPVVVMALY